MASDQAVDEPELSFSWVPSIDGAMERNEPLPACTGRW